MNGEYMTSQASSDPVVAFAADNHYAMPLAATIASVTANLGKERSVNIFIVDGGLAETAKEKIMQLEDRHRVIIRWLKPSQAHCDLLTSLPHGYVGRTCYYKMFIPDLLGPEYSRILYLDSDVIVEADITSLWTAEIGNNYVLASQDLINPLVSSPFGLRNWRELDRKADDALFNAGVLVLNAAKWHEEKVSLSLVEYLRCHYRQVQLCDQDAMNAVFRNKWGRLDIRWNVLPHMNVARGYCLLDRNTHEDLLTRAYVVHYCGPNKPWNPRCRHPRADRFYHYLDMTAWSGWRPKQWAFDRDFLTYYMRRAQAFFQRSLRSFST